MSINVEMILQKYYVLYIVCISIMSLVSLKCKSVKVLVLSVTRQGTKALSLSAPPPPNKSLMFVPHSPFIPSVPPCPLPIPTLLVLSSSWLQLQPSQGNICTETEFANWPIMMESESGSGFHTIVVSKSRERSWTVVKAGKLVVSPLFGNTTGNK